MANPLSSNDPESLEQWLIWSMYEKEKNEYFSIIIQKKAGDRFNEQQSGTGIRIHAIVN